MNRYVLRDSLKEGEETICYKALYTAMGKITSRTLRFLQGKIFTPKIKQSEKELEAKAGWRK